MSPNLWIVFLVMGVAWIFLVVFTIRAVHADPRGSVGLPAAVLLTMSFIYGGAFVYAIPGYDHKRSGAHWYLARLDFTVEMVVAATLVSLLALLGFAIGTGALRRRKVRKIAPPKIPSKSQREAALKLMLVFGAVGFVGHYFEVSFPLSNAFFETGRNVLVAALLTGAYTSIRLGKSPLPWILPAMLVPIYYFLAWGFVSHSFIFGMALVGFWLTQLQPSRKSFGTLRATLATVAIVYFLLTLFVAWFSFRDEIRLMVWGSGAGSILEVLLRAISQTQLFSLWNFGSLDYVNIRLNLGVFIGRMMEHHSSFPELRQYGATLIILPLVLVPRFIWPNKPERGGSDFMAEHTGLFFQGNTTFGTGPVFEFYVNFGAAGVFFGFVALGWLVRWIDRMATMHLSRGRYIDFALFYVVGIIAIDPMLRPFFVVNGAIFALIIMTLLKLVARRST